MFSFLPHINLLQLFQPLIVVGQTPPTSVSWNNSDLFFVTILWVGLHRELSGQFFCFLWHWLEDWTFSLIHCDWAGLETPRRFYSVTRWPGASRVTSTHILLVLSHSVVVCGEPGFSHGSWFPRGKKRKACNPLKSGARRSQEPTHHFFCITNYKATPNLKGRGSGPYLFKGWRWACAYGEGQERW